MKNNKISVQRLKQLVNYAPDTGEFTWNMPRRKCRTGDKAGCRMKNGYIVLRLDDCLFYAHRLAWFYVNEVWPANVIDHINGDRSDNRFSNLREATIAQNAQNSSRIRSTNTSGFTGVRRENKKWLAEIKVNYKPMRLGLFNTPEEAHEAYLIAKHNLHPFFTR
jgi:hypothetical protein